MAVTHSDMSAEQITEFLLAPRIAVLATNPRDGAPQVTPVWYLYDERRIYVSMFVTSAKYRNLRRDPRASLCVAAEHPDARAVVLRGDVEFLEREGDARASDIDWRITRRYYETDAEAEAFIRSVADTGESALMMLTPQRVIAQDFN